MPGSHRLGRPRSCKEKVTMRDSIKEYCDEEKLTIYELFCKAYANYIGRPVSLSHMATVNRDVGVYQANNHDSVPTYVADFIEKERRRQMELFAQ
jgi:hypothetical protein